jgi:hypothetical protein
MALPTGVGDALPELLFARIGQRASDGAPGIASSPSNPSVPACCRVMPALVRVAGCVESPPVLSA